MFVSWVCDSPLTLSFAGFFKGKTLGFDEEATHPSFLCVDHDLSWEGRCGAPGLATLHSTLGAFAFPKSCFSIEREPHSIFFFFFCHVASEESGLEINANSFHPAMCPVV